MHPDNQMTDDQVNAAFRNLRRLKKQYDSKLDGHELAALMIGASILEGFNEGKRITGALAKLDFNKQHIGMILKDLTGVQWSRDNVSGYYFMP